MDMIFNTLLSTSTAVGEPTLISAIGTLFMLIILQAVLGFDNLLYISLESKRAPEEKQVSVRKLGIGIAIVLRVILLFTLVTLIPAFQKNVLFSADTAWFSGAFNGHSLIVLFGGVFILYTATKEVLHMMHIEHGHNINNEKKSAAAVITMIVMMNVIFSFDSILSAMSLARYEDAEGNAHYTVWVMVVAILVSGVLMIWLADKVSDFLQKNRMYEVLGLFILFVVGIMLLTEGAHLAHMELFGEKIQEMTKTTFYFVIGVLVITDIVQTRYQKKLLAEKARAEANNDIA